MVIIEKDMDPTFWGVGSNMRMTLEVLACRILIYVVIFWSLD